MYCLLYSTMPCLESVITETIKFRAISLIWANMAQIDECCKFPKEKVFLESRLFWTSFSLIKFSASAQIFGQKLNSIFSWSLVLTETNFKRKCLYITWFSSIIDCLINIILWADQNKIEMGYWIYSSKYKKQNSALN